MTRISGASIGRRAKPQRICLGCGSAVLPPKKECCSKNTVLFASQAEVRRYNILRLMLFDGQIQCLQCHPKFPLIISNEVSRQSAKIGVYTADFAYEKNGKPVIEDVKAHKTVKGVRKPLMSEAAALRIKLFEALYGMKVVFVE